MDPRTLARFPLLALAMLSLLAGVLGGLARLAVDVPAFGAQAGVHGALMIAAFFGTVISLERAVALGRLWPYLAPALAGLGGLTLLGGLPAIVAQSLFAGGALTLFAGSVAVMRRQTVLFTVVLALGAASWLVGNLVWLATGLVQAAIPWWLGFLVLTIAGERLELTRFLPARPAAAPLFVASVVILLAGALASHWREGMGLGVFAWGLLALSAWLLRYDIARHNARQRGLTRFIAICLLSGYVWLAIGAVLGIGGNFAAGAPMRDAALHAVVLGFVFSMVFGHAPIIFPAVAKVRIPYHPVFYAPLIVLHVSLALRVIGNGDDAFVWRQHGALVNAFALLLFVVTMVTSVVRGRRRNQASRTEPHGEMR
ncbi:hypothetical protein [Aromatoleum sp.]|uniref:hypothetical protein n=1 Tax=Aromatoleum sp. TaxID=2307007 RepID=UPI002FCA077C